MNARRWARVAAWVHRREQRAVQRELPLAVVWWSTSDGKLYRDWKAVHAAYALAEHMDKVMTDPAAKLAAGERERQQLRDALADIALNAEAWHGEPPTSGRGAGHARALAVVGGWARAVLAGEGDATPSGRIWTPEQHDQRCPARQGGECIRETGCTGDATPPEGGAAS